MSLEREGRRDDALLVLKSGEGRMYRQWGVMALSAMRLRLRQIRFQKEVASLEEHRI